MKPARAWPGLSGRLAMAVTIGSLLSGCLELLLCRLVPHWPAGITLLVVTLVASPTMFFVCRYVIMREVRAAMLAVSDGLLSLTERDYSLRLAAGGPQEVATLKQRFNTLATALRDERNDVFQRQIMLETVLRGTSLAVVLVNEAARVVFSNAAARELLGRDQRLEGQQMEALLADAPEELRRAAHSSNDLVFTFDRLGYEPETFRLIKRYFQLNSQSHTLYLFTPLTKELARQEVETWKKSIRVMSHEVNNSLAPVSSLIHSARLMVNAPEHAPRLATALATIEERATHLRTFLEGYANFARLPMPNKAPCTFAELLKGLEGLYPFRVEGVMPEKPLKVDRAQLQQVLINLLKNASESGSESEDIVVSFVVNERGNGGHEFQILDRGKGMTDEVLRSALLPFYSTKKTGSGLGLPLCREILEAHDGRLGLSLRAGGGICVSCWLP